MNDDLEGDIGQRRPGIGGRYSHRKDEEELTQHRGAGATVLETGDDARDQIAGPRGGAVEIARDVVAKQAVVRVAFELEEQRWMDRVVDGKSQILAQVDVDRM